MKRVRTPFLFLVLVLVLTACGPTITVVNNTKIPVRVAIHSGFANEVESPSPGESSTVDAQEGFYSVDSIPDQEWVDYAKATRAFLNAQLANSQNLTGPQLLDVVARLKDIANRIVQMSAAAGSRAHCSATVSNGGDATASISIAPDGTLVATCGSSTGGSGDTGGSAG